MENANAVPRTPISDLTFDSYLTSNSLDGFLNAYKTVLKKHELPKPQDFNRWYTNQDGSLFYDGFLVILYNASGFSPSPRAPHYARNRIKVIGF